jgi:SAM-dependent methyltransferase
MVTPYKSLDFKGIRKDMFLVAYLLRVVPIRFGICRMWRVLAVSFFSTALHHFATAIVLESFDEHLFLAKTRETFKFSDLQAMQAQLDVAARGDRYRCRRLVLDTATGSSLLQLNVGRSDPGMLFKRHAPIDMGSKASFMVSAQAAATSANDNLDALPPSLARCEWVAQVMAHGSNASDLIYSLAEHDGGKGVKIDNCTGWVLDYVRMSSLRKDIARETPSLPYNLKTLLCTVAQTLRSPAALVAASASDELMLVETTQQGIYLGRVVWRGTALGSNAGFAAKWARRPFQYSSAIHPTVADIIVEIVLDLVTQPSARPHSPIRILDPTCGSGTFLAFALGSNKGITFAEGWDVNHQCIEGAKENLVYCYGHEEVKAKCQLLVKDSSIMPLEGTSSKLSIDCVVANLPWGKNTFEYVDQNVKILASLQKQLVPGTPCVFVHSGRDARLSSSRQLADLGYLLIADAMVPPANFLPPKSRKKGSNDTSHNVFALDTTKTMRQKVTVVRTMS